MLFVEGDKSRFARSVKTLADAVQLESFRGYAQLVSYSPRVWLIHSFGSMGIRLYNQLIISRFPGIEQGSIAASEA